MANNRVLKYEDVFIPGSPVSEKRFMKGREQEKRDLQKILDRKGQHAVVIGDRGVGKTSLVKQVLSTQRRPFAWYTTSPELTYNQIFQLLFRKIGIDAVLIEKTVETSSATNFEGSVGIVKGGKEGLEKTSHKYEDSRVLTPALVHELLTLHASKSIIIIDEYDAINTIPGSCSESLHRDLAYTIKQISDHSDVCSATIIVVGVAFSAESLLGPHESVRRNAKEIYLKPLKYTHILEFIEEAERYLCIQFEEMVKERIVEGSMGYPYFLHLIGQNAIEAMLDRDRNERVVRWVDFGKAVNKAVEMEARDAMAKYRTKASELTQIEEDVLCELTYNKSYGIDRKDFVEMMHKNFGHNEDKIQTAFLKLGQERKLIYISRHTDEIRFQDPLMKAFLRAKIYKSKVENTKERIISNFK